MALKAATAGEEALPPDGKSKPDKTFVLDPLIK